MEREGILKSYEREGPFIGPARKYYNIDISKTYVATITPNIFWYRGLDLGDEHGGGEIEINLDLLKESPENLLEMIDLFMRATKELEKVLEALRAIESRRDRLMKSIKDTYLKEIGDMTQLAILHYVLLNGRATVDELSDRLNLKEREVLQKAEELDRFVPLRIKDSVIEVDEERLKAKLGGETDAGED